MLRMSLHKAHILLNTINGVADLTIPFTNTSRLSEITSLLLKQCSITNANLRNSSPKEWNV